jgi:hypothetical protein
MNESLESLELQGRMMIMPILQGPLFSPHQQGSKSLIVTFEEDAAESHVPPFVLTLRPCCKGTRHLRLTSERADNQSRGLYRTRPRAPRHHTLKTLSIYPKGRVDRRRRQTNGCLPTKNYSWKISPDMDLRMK